MCTYDLDSEELLTAFEQLREEGYYHGKRILIKEKSITLYEPPIKCTYKELEFLTLNSSEMTYREIADKMYLSPKTVDGYRDAWFEKLEVKSRTGLAIQSILMGLVDIENFKPYYNLSEGNR